MAQQIFAQKTSAEQKLREWLLAEHRMTVDLMLDNEKVHEMVVVALERDWHVIDAYINRLQDMAAVVIREGIAAGEFPEQDPIVASRCLGASTVILSHPQMVAQCLSKTNRAGPEDLVDFALRALKHL